MKSNPPDLRVFADLETLSRAAAASIAERIRGRAAAGQTFSLVLSGGKTPEALYRRFSGVFRDRIPWKHVLLFWGDERYVPPGDPRSNFGMAERSLLRHVPIPPGNVHRMPTEYPEPELAAQAYEETLRARFPAPWPRFDLVLLGIGDDGHTASLFPGSAALRERQRQVVAAQAPAEPPVRLTLTLPVLNHAACVYFLAAGPSKAPALRSALAATSQEAVSPAGLVRPAGGELVWWTDEAAAQLLPRSLRQ